MPPEKGIITVHNILDKKNRAKENLFFKAAKENNVKLLKRLIGEDVDPSMKGAMGETVLHTAAMYNNQEALVVLLDAFPFLINKPMECDIYKGETVLHIAVVNQNTDMVKELIARKADTRNARAVGTFFAPRKKGYYYYGEYVTSFAAAVGNKEILQLLVESGAPLDSQDNQGNTVFHILVLHPNKLMACKIYDFLVSLIPKEQVPHLESITNNEGLTPLKLSAQEGDLAMFKHFMKRRRQAYWAFGPLTSTLYDLTGIDSWNDRQSVIDVICNSRNDAEAYKTKGDYVRLVGEIVVVLGAIVILATEISQFIRKGAKHFFGNTVTGGPFHIIMLLYACFIISMMVLRFLNNEDETVVMSLALICAWCNVIYFARGFKLLGPLCIMIQKMILGDLLRFCIILITVLIGFAAAFYIHFQTVNVALFPYFCTFPVTLFTLFQLMMGLDNLPIPSDVNMPKMIMVLYMVYMFFAFVLLLNLLIALMTDTHFRVNKERNILWRAQIAATTIMLERIVPSWLWPRTGIPGEILGLEDGKWYLRVEEKNDVFLPEKKINVDIANKPLGKEWSLVHTNITNRVLNKRIHQRILEAQI
ncbi:transient receptor potential cation channel subfamily V member 6-like isoform 2-T2 [Discoglossus pictus]